MSIRTLIVDDHKLNRDGIRRILVEIPGVEIVAEAEDGRGAMQMVRGHDPDLVLIEAALPGRSSVDLVGEIRREKPETRILAMSKHSDRVLVGRMMKAGASGYLLRCCGAGDLRRAVETVMKGELYRVPGLEIPLDPGPRIKADTTATRPPLTPREREVLQLLAEGRSTKEIAESLFISAKTVETHRKHIMDKLDLHTVAQLTKYAIQTGLTSLER